MTQVGAIHLSGTSVERAHDGGAGGTEGQELTKGGIHG